MKNQIQNLVKFFVMTIAITAFAGKRGPEFSPKEMKEIVKIARSIHSLNPRMDDSKYMEYAVGIFKASKKYGIEPTVLVSIAQQESSFRENLPEGKAGERGICQIRKMWLKNRYFVQEFRNQSVEDLEKPHKSFLFAAWILQDLKKNATKGSLPYWSYYNSVRFENRFRYFLAVNRNIATLLRQEVSDLEVTETLVAEGPKVELMPPRQAASVAPKFVAKTAPVKAVAIAQSKPRVSRSTHPNDVKLNKAVFSNDVQEIVVEGTHWIPDALRRMQKAKEAEKSQGNQAFRPSYREVAAN